MADTLWDRLTLICGRPILCTAALEPVEVEALLNGGGSRLTRTVEGRASIVETVEDTIPIARSQFADPVWAGDDCESIRQRYSFVFGAMTAYVPRALHDELWALIQMGVVPV